MVYKISASLSCLLLLLNLTFGKKYFFHSLFFTIIGFIFVGQENPNIDLMASNRFLGTPVVYFPVMMTCLGLSLHYFYKYKFTTFFYKLSSPADKFILLFLIWFSLVGVYQGGTFSALPYLAGYLFLWYSFRLERIIFADEVSDKEFKVLESGISLSLVC